MKFTSLRKRKKHVLMLNQSKKKWLKLVKYAVGTPQKEAGRLLFRAWVKKLKHFHEH